MEGRDHGREKVDWKQKDKREREVGREIDKQIVWYHCCFGIKNFSAILLTV